MIMICYIVTEMYLVPDLRSFIKEEIINKNVLTDSDITQMIEQSKSTKIWWLPIKDSKIVINYLYL